MRGVIRSVTIVLAGAAMLLMPTASGFEAAAGQSGGSAQASGDRAKLVGTYELVTTETRDATGKWSPIPDYNSNGYIIYAETGHMGVHIMPKVRAKFAANPPTASEAQAALRGYAAYFGSFAVHDNERDKFVVHHRLGHINARAEVDVRRYYDFVTTPNGSQRLILTPPPEDGGPKEKATRRIVWQRMPDAPLSAEEKKFVGFYKLLYTDSYRTMNGKEVFHGNKVETRAGTSYIIYTASGHMMVHLMDREGRTGYAGAEPTPDEALKAYRSYGGYFGRFRTYENQRPAFVYHSQQGSLNPSSYSEQKRFYQFTGQRPAAGRTTEPQRRGRAGRRTSLLGASGSDPVAQDRPGGPARQGRQAGQARRPEAVRGPATDTRTIAVGLRLRANVEREQLVLLSHVHDPVRDGRGRPGGIPAGRDVEA